MQVIMRPSPHSLIQFTEENVKKTYISPVTSLLLSLSLVVGIFVAGLTNSHVLPAAQAQTIEEITSPSPDGKLVGTVIAVQGVVVNGVATNALIPGGVRFNNTFVDLGCGITTLGYSSTGDTVYSLGVFTSGTLTGSYTTGGPNGVFTSGTLTGSYTTVSPNGVFTSGTIYVGDSLQVVGGALSG